MIVNLSDQLIEVVAELDDLEIKHSNQTDLRDTLSIIVEIDDLVGRLAAQIHTIQSSINEFQANYIASEADDIRTDIEKTQELFEEELRQVARLQTSFQRLDNLEKNVRAAWGEYIEKKLRPYRELFEQIKRLPEVVEIADNIELALTDVSQLGRIPPRSDAELKKIESRFTKLHELFSDKVNLSPSVRAFLSKVLNGTATFKNLSDEVLEWIMESDRARAFRISFLKN